uniref:Nuclear pore complex protein Nup214 n=1 Tax=Sinocyclocheilus rhinocerous TaxID=307959 RepID=A0A673K3S8_9TELE
MGDDPDSIPEREMKDFQFRQMKKIRVFESSADLPKERSSLLAISNKYGLTFVGKDETLKVFWTRDVIAAGRLEGNPNDTVECSCAVMVTVGVAMHHMALSSDELTLSVCGMGDTAELTLDFYDVRTFLNKDRQEKRPFTSFKPAAAVDTLVQDLKWSPVDASRLAVCLSDGSMMVLDVQDSVSVVAQLPASEGITCVCWSPKGKQVSAGKEDATVVQFTPTLQAKKVIPCPSFYSQDHPVKVLDVLWLSTYNFAVAYAAADGSLETPPELVVVSLPKKDEKRDEHYLNFNDLVYGTCTERQHHYYLCHIEDWDLVLASSAAAIEVSIIAKQEDKVNWELWLLEDASRAELPVTENSEDTLPVGMAIDYTSQEDIHLSDEKRLPPAPTLMLLSTDGVLCPFSLLNLNPGVKQLTVAAVPLPEEGERAPAATSSIFPSFPASSGTALPPATLSFTAPPPAATAATSLAPPTSASSTGFSFSLPALGSTTSSGFSLGSATGGFSFSAPKPSSDAPAFSFASSLAPKEVSSAPAATPPQRPPAMSPIISGPKAPAEPATPAIRMNLTDSVFACVLWQVMSVKALEKNLQQKKDSDPVMTGILEEIGHFEKELDDLKTRCRNADFRVGSTDDMRDLRKDSENLHAFTLEIKDATESLHGDISALKTSLLEGFAGAEEARAQSELNRDKDYLQLLYKKPLDPRREEQLKEIRRLYQYVKFAMEDVNDVLDVEWEKHLEKKKKHMIIPEREALFAALANNLDIINQQKQRLDRLESDLHKLRLYRGTSVWSFTSLTPSTPSGQSLDSELESLKDALLKASLETTPKAPAKSPSKMTPAKQSQLRNFLSKRQTPPVHSTAPANLSRSAFLSPQFYEDLDEVSSSSSLSQPLEPEDSLALAEEEDEPAPIPVLMPSVPRHPAVVRTPSIQPGFSMQSSPFSRVQTVPIPVISPGEVQTAPQHMILVFADSTALATKTVKHGAPPTEKIMPTTIPAPQAAGRAALSRHMTSQKPGTNILSFRSVIIHIYTPYTRFYNFSHSGLPGKFSFASSTGTNMTFGPVGSEEPFSFTSKLSSPAQSMSSSTQPPELSKLPQAPKAQGNAGETLGSFSGLRVGQSEEGKEAPKTTLGFTFGQPGNGSTGFAFSSAQIKLAETGSSSESTGTAAEAPKMTTAQGFGSSTFTFKPQEGTAPSFTIPSTSSFPPAATSFSSLLRAPLSETQTLPTKSLQSETTTSTEPAPSADTESKEPPAEPSPKPPTLSAPSAVPVTEAAAPTSNEPTTAPSNKPPTPPALEVSSAPPPLVTPPSETPAPVSEPPAAEPVSDTAPETTTTSTSTTTPAPQETPATTPSSAPTSEKPGSIFAPTSGGTDSLTVGAINLTSVVTSAASSAPSAAITTSAAPTPVFGQPTSAAPTTVFGSTIFGANSTTSGFGKPAFGQSSSAGFGQPAASGSASGFSFGQQAFSASSGFGQPAAATTTSATNSGGGGLFGSSSTNSASSFSFVASATSSAASSGTGFFGQSSAPVFGQSSSGFGQGSMFGSNTTTASSTGFGFGQQPGGFLGSALFIMYLNDGSVFCAPERVSYALVLRFLCGLFPSGPSNLFGNSGAKGFSFGNSSFGEQKPSGSFSSGTGSVAAQGFGSFSTPTKPAGFGSAPVFGSPPTFGGSPAFGGSAGFGSAPSFGSPQGSSSGKVFGEGTTAANVGGFGFASPQSAPSFGSLAGASTAPSFGGLAQQQQQPPGFGAQSGAFSGFGSSGGEFTASKRCCYCASPYSRSRTSIKN